jgi:hypothetical protein
MNLKHIKDYGDYIYEQDMMGMDGEASAAPKPVNHTFIFIEEGETGDHKFPDGTSVKAYPTYVISKDDLREWIDKNITPNKEEKGLKALDIKKDSVREYIIGESSTITPDNKQYLKVFKNQVKTGQIGEKIGETEVIFYPEENQYGTDKVDVTFIITPKS